MTCPICGEKTKVVESMSYVDLIERRRECTSCGYRFTTYEIERDLYKRMVKNSDKG